ncbi:hypothetical protein DL93DRAFT_500532 [Clavulina sp. PMI_390]|nr:hypothetical protein DL93DRAFT_500532 [Clavulina sp. PMI_390]
MIPESVLLEILRCSHFLDIVRCRAVCQAWTTLISSSAMLKYIVWLGITGQHDGDASFIPRMSDDRLRILLGQEAAWENLVPRRVETLKVAAESYLNTLQDGTLGYCTEISSSEALLCLQKIPSLISQVEVGVPSQFRVWWGEYGFDEPKWDLHHSSLFIRAVFDDFDPQSLLPLVYLMDLRDVSLPHPLAGISEVTAVALQLQPPPGPAPDIKFILQQCTIHSDRLLLEIEGHPLPRTRDNFICIALWDWVKGYTVTRFWIPPFWCTKHHSHACGMLDSSTIIVVHNRTSHSPFIALRLYEVCKEGEDELGDLDPRLRRTFLLPELGEENRNLDIRFSLSSLDESTKWPQNPSTEQIPMNSDLRMNSKPFRPTSATSDRLCEIRVTDRRRSWEHTCCFVFLAEALLRDYDGEVVPWEGWGASNAACLHGVPTVFGPGTDGPIEAMFGSRLARLHSPRPARGDEVRGINHTLHVLELLDFSRDRVKRYVNPFAWPNTLDSGDFATDHLGEAPADHDTGSGLLAWSATWTSPGIFTKWPPSVALPFVISRLEIPEWSDKDFTQMVMDSERIVLCTSGSSNETPEMLVVTF